VITRLLDAGGYDISAGGAEEGGAETVRRAPEAGRPSAKEDGLDSGRPRAKMSSAQGKLADMIDLGSRDDLVSVSRAGGDDADGRLRPVGS
jgi:hypothetical protein